MTKFITSCALLFALLLAPVPALATTHSWSRHWGRIAQCESGKRWHLNTGNGYYGGLQFSLPTWRGYGGGRFASYPNHATRYAQKTIAERVLRHQGIGAWPVCGRLG